MSATDNKYLDLGFEHGSEPLNYRDILDIFVADTFVRDNIAHTSNANKAAVVMHDCHSVYLDALSSLNSKKFNLPSFITDINIKMKVDLERLPYQQVDLIDVVSEYAADPFIFPRIGTAKGYAPQIRRRFMLVSVMKVILLHLCFHTYRIGRYTKTGFQPISIMELARIAGFTYIDKNGEEQIERSWERAYNDFSKAYLCSIRPNGFNLNSVKSWHRSFKYMSDLFFNHLFEAMPGLMSSERFEGLRQAAKLRYEKLEKRSFTARLLLNTNIKKEFQKLASNVQPVIDSFLKLGFNSFSAKEIATLTVINTIELTKSTRSHFGVLDPPLST